jgi:ketosteroid isomerase-like protein
MTDLQDLVRRQYETLRSGDVDGFLALVRHDVEFTSLIMEPEATVYDGHDGVRAYLESLLSVLPDWRPVVERTERLRTGVLVKARVTATGPASDAAVEQIMWQVVAFQDGLCRYWCFFRTESEAREHAATDPLLLTLLGFEAINAGDLEAVLDLVAADVDLRPALVGGMERTVYHGSAGYREWFEEQLAVFDGIAFERAEMRRIDEHRILALYDVRTRGKGSGIEFSEPWAVIFTFRDGLLVQQVGYRDPAEALRVAAADG